MNKQIKTHEKLPSMQRVKSNQIFIIPVWASTRENLSSEFANNKGEDHPAHTHSLISAFVIHLLESIISKLALCKISIFQLII